MKKRLCLWPWVALLFCFGSCTTRHNESLKTGAPSTQIFEARRTRDSRIDELLELSKSKIEIGATLGDVKRALGSPLWMGSDHVQLLTVVGGQVPVFLPDGYILIATPYPEIDCAVWMAISPKNVTDDMSKLDSFRVEQFAISERGTVIWHWGF